MLDLAARMSVGPSSGFIRLCCPSGLQPRLLFHCPTSSSLPLMDSELLSQWLRLLRLLIVLSFLCSFTLVTMAHWSWFFCPHFHPQSQTHLHHPSRNHLHPVLHQDWRLWLQSSHLLRLVRLTSRMALWWSKVRHPIPHSWYRCYYSLRLIAWLRRSAQQYSYSLPRTSVAM